MKVNALELFLKQYRFDLIYKYLYAKDKDPYIKFAYLESIRAFNDFYEKDPPKNSPDDFIRSFDDLIDSIQKCGFDVVNGKIPISNDDEQAFNGAHRLSVSAAKNLDVEVEFVKHEYRCDYKYFRKREMNESVMDFGALEYVKLNPKAYIVNLHSITDPQKDDAVEGILNKYGFVYYKKNVNMTFNGYVNLKKLSYGSFWEREKWIGDIKNKFAGAQSHALQSFGKNPLRVFVFVCDELQKVIKAKAEIRALFNIGNFSVHINDTREEAIWLAETYFNKNSLDIINRRPFVFEDEDFDNRIDKFKEECAKAGVPVDKVCGAGSTPMNVAGIRKSGDFDYLSIDDTFNFDPEEFVFSLNEKQLKYYPYSKEEIINNPMNYFYYRGLKFISLDVLYKMKKKRGEDKDILDCKRIKNLLSNEGFVSRFLYKVFRIQSLWFIFVLKRKILEYFYLLRRVVGKILRILKLRK